MINLGPVNTTTSVLLQVLLIFVIVIPTTVTGECTCENRQDRDDTTNTSTLTYYKIGAVASILIAGGIGVSLPLVGRKIEALNPESDIFFMIKAFAAGVILATGFVHILPDAFQILTSPCLKDNPWGRFPFTGFVAMMSSICTLIIDTLATSFYKTRHFNNNNKPSSSSYDAAAANVADDEGNGVDVVVVDHDHDEHAGHVHVHTHTSNGHAHGSAAPAIAPELIRHRIISQVLELGIVVHSVIIGISLGASGNPETIKPLMAALCFHQFFEGMGLGGCISQAKFKSLSTVIMGVFFSVTAPIGIVIGIGVSRELRGGGGMMMIVQGVFNSASAGILIYMALVDLLAADFMNPRMQANTRLQLGANISLLLGAGCMSVLAKWA